jgi:crotonobetainyl-CoA:carnitine CoA-transferase CaiB-like acyl-CoA transferase
VTYDILEGIRVIEVSQFAFVPAAGAVLADWGADVVKVVHPVYGDVMHTAAAFGLPPLADGTAFMWEIANRNKRSIGVDISTDDGGTLIHELAAGADVFLTNFLQPARQRLGIDVDDIRATNPDIIYARGHGHGPKGPERDAGGYDSVSFWARTGWANAISSAADQFVSQPGPGSGDLPSGFALASGVVGALLRRERTGTPSVVDVSLMAVGMWGMAGSIVASELYGVPAPPIRSKAEVGNAMVAAYETKDGRYLFFSGLVHDKGYRDFAERIDHPELVVDERFRSAEARAQHYAEFIGILDEAFASRTLEEWRPILDGCEIPWSVVQTSRELHTDPQVVANGYLQDAGKESCPKLRLPASPVQFDEQEAKLQFAPEPGQDTESILLELGKDWDEITRLKQAGAIT